MENEESKQKNQVSFKQSNLESLIVKKDKYQSLSYQLSDHQFMLEFKAKNSYLEHEPQKGQIWFYRCKKKVPKEKSDHQYDSSAKIKTWEGEIEIMRDDLTTYKGEWNKGDKEGLGVETYKDGSTYQGDFVKDKRNGLGLMIYDLPFGRAGTVQYDGQWEDGKKHGKGQEQYISIDAKMTTYQGDFENNLKHGEGVFLMNNGYQYDGKWVRGVKEGWGEEIMHLDIDSMSHQQDEDLKRFKTVQEAGSDYQTTWIYNGYFQNNKKHGIGAQTIQFSQDGSILTYQGQFENGFRHGYGVMVDHAKKEYEKCYYDNDKWKMTIERGIVNIKDGEEDKEQIAKDIKEKKKKDKKKEKKKDKKKDKKDKKDKKKDKDKKDKKDKKKEKEKHDKNGSDIVNNDDSDKEEFVDLLADLSPKKYIISEFQKEPNFEMQMFFNSILINKENKQGSIHFLQFQEDYLIEKESDEKFVKDTVNKNSMSDYQKLVKLFFGGSIKIQYGTYKDLSREIKNVVENSRGIVKCTCEPSYRQNREDFYYLVDEKTMTKNLEKQKSEENSQFYLKSLLLQNSNKDSKSKVNSLQKINDKYLDEFFYDFEILPLSNNIFSSYSQKVLNLNPAQTYSYACFEFEVTFETNISIAIFINRIDVKYTKFYQAILARKKFYRRDKNTNEQKFKYIYVEGVGQTNEETLNLTTKLQPGSYELMIEFEVEMNPLTPQEEINPYALHQINQLSQNSISNFIQLNQLQKPPSNELQKASSSIAEAVKVGPRYPDELIQVAVKVWSQQSYIFIKNSQIVPSSGPTIFQDVFESMAQSKPKQIIQQGDKEESSIYLQQEFNQTHSTLVQLMYNGTTNQQWEHKTDFFVKNMILMDFEKQGQQIQTLSDMNNLDTLQEIKVDVTLNPLNKQKVIIIRSIRNQMKDKNYLIEGGESINGIKDYNAGTDAQK
eukprot:403349162